MSNNNNYIQKLNKNKKKFNRKQKNRNAIDQTNNIKKSIQQS